MNADRRRELLAQISAAREFGTVPPERLAQWQWELARLAQPGLPERPPASYSASGAPAFLGASERQSSGCLGVLAVVVGIPLGLVMCIAVAVFWQDHMSTGDSGMSPSNSAVCQQLVADREVAKGAYLISNDGSAFSADLNRIAQQEITAGC